MTWWVGKRRLRRDDVVGGYLRLRRDDELGGSPTVSPDPLAPNGRHPTPSPVMPAEAGIHARRRLLYVGGWRFIRWLLIVSVVIKRVRAEAGVDPDLRRDDVVGEAWLQTSGLYRCRLRRHDVAPPPPCRLAAPSCISLRHAGGGRHPRQAPLALRWRLAVRPMAADREGCHQTGVHAEAGVGPGLRRDDETGGDAAAASG